MLGDTISHYRILRKLGEGGMGQVFLAQDTDLDRKIALKVLHPDTAGEQDRLERFRREARSLASLNHPNIVTIYSVEEVDGLNFLTMEYVEGRTLSELIPKDGLPLNQFFEYSVPLAEALSVAHEQGIVHRDLKPANIMVGRDKRIRVLDFGLAKLREREPRFSETLDSTDPTQALTADGRIVGTTPYMSPEQLKGEPVDPRSDIFALGVVLYRMATGHHPFARRSSAETISAILKEQPPPVTEENLTLPRQLGRVVQHCMEKDANHRFQTALDVRNELEQLKDEVSKGGAPTSAESLFPVAPKRWISWRTAWVGLTLVLAMAIGVMVISKVRSQSATPLKAIAVMPFINLSGDPAQDHLGKALSVGLITKLRELKRVQLASRAEAWSYLDSELSIGGLGRELGVGAIVDGEIQEVEPMLRASVSLTDTYTGLVLWSEFYSVSGDGLFDLQDQMARGLATFLSIPLSPRDRRRLAREPTESLRAYDYFVAGQALLDQVENLRGPDLAADNFQQALRIDPEFALAQVGLSEALWRVYHRDQDMTALEGAVTAAEEAVRIDPNLAEAQLALARGYRSTGRSAQSVEELTSLLAQLPNPDEALRELASSYEAVGEAEQALRASTALAPDSWVNWNSLGMNLAAHGKYAEAREAFEQATELAPPETSLPYENLATVDLAEGRIDDAIDAYEQIPKPIRDGRLATNIGTAYFFSDRPEKWGKVEEYYLLAVRLSPRDAINRANLGDLYLQLNRQDEAVENYRMARDLVRDEVGRQPQDIELLSRLSLYAAKGGDCGEALEHTPTLELGDQDTARLAHRRAYIYALCDRPDEAIGSIRKAITLGESPEIIGQEPEFKALSELPEFQALTGT